jgi:hypothetical protein
MATLSPTGYLTLADIARFTLPNGSISRQIAEVLAEYNDIHDDMLWREGNTDTGHVSVVRTSQPAGTFRLINQGIASSKSTGGQVVNTCGSLEALSHMDALLAKLGGKKEAVRAAQDMGIVQGLSNTLSSKLIYGDQGTTPEEFDGFATRYFSLGTTYTTSGQLIDGGGTGSDNTSVWLVCWAPDKVYGIYPRGTQAGLSMEDDGLVTIEDPNSAGTYLRMWQTHFQWLAGIAVDDYRYVARICNIDISNLETASDGTDTSTNLLKHMSRAIDFIPPGSDVKPAFYMNRRAMSMLRVKMDNKANVHLSVDNVTTKSGFGRRQLSFYEVPIRRIDSILNTESQITTATTS